MKPQRHGRKRLGMASAGTSSSAKPNAAAKASRRQSRKRSAAEPKPRRKHRAVEQPIHMNAVQWFQATYPHVMAWHTPNGEKRDRKTAEKLQRMGVLPGVADWLMFPKDGRKIAIEFKTHEKGSSESEDQERFAKWWRGVGGLYYTVRSVDEFKVLCTELLGPSFASLVLR